MLHCLIAEVNPVIGLARLARKRDIYKNHNKKECVHALNKWFLL